MATYAAAAGSACWEGLLSPHIRDELEVRVSERGSGKNPSNCPQGHVAAGAKRKLKPQHPSSLFSPLLDVPRDQGWVLHAETQKEGLGQ